MHTRTTKSPTKIRIIGSVGSGKTTLAKTISTKLNIPYFELDNVAWKRTVSGDIRRDADERDEYLNQILDTDTWIIEGVHHKWGLESFQRADLIVYLDIRYSTRLWRIAKRFIRQKLGVEKAHYKPRFHMLKMMFIWNSIFERESKPEILDILQQYRYKLVVLTDNVDVNRCIIDLEKLKTS